MSENSKKTDLFRFVTLRSPEVISHHRIDLGFIYHPDPMNSYFLEDLDGVTDVAAGRTILAGKAGTYITANSPEDVKNLNLNFWKFSDWLVKNQTNLTRINVDANISALPTPAIILEIWDNMLYDVLTKKNPNIRQTCLQLIIAINFAQKYTTYASLATTDPAILAQEAKDLGRLATGKVILHQSFTTEKDLHYSPASFGKLSSYKRHEALHSARIKAIEGTKLREIKAGFTRLKKDYETDYASALNSQLANYKTQVKQTVSNYFSQNPNAIAAAKKTVNQSLTIIGNTNTSSNASELTRTLTTEHTNLESVIPPDLVDRFEFSYAAPLSTNYASSKISKAGMRFVADKSLEKEDVTTAIKHLDREIKTFEKEAHTVFRSRPKEILVNGIPVKANNLGLKDFTVSFNKIISEVDERLSYTLYASMDAGYDNAYIRSGSYSLKIGTETHTTTDFKLFSNVTETIFGELYETTALTSLPENLLVEFTATFELNNGQVYTVALEGLTSNTNISGSAVPTKANSTPVDLHYGVNRIGVADYRKVEQELCCYVPGEVAHIENVMAREYKEKSTRSLTRSEFSTSSETERETEESLDTTATSRNEMNSEIANVIDEEKSKNFGFNASVSGEAPGKIKTQAGVSGDFSMGKSSSDSNAVSRTFAEDLTKRALERITQKISSKRSSKLIKEFEEKNNHGFDNRAGDKHVTGVYRWIDKVYKNRIINYGKRLIYEFMVPEPSRFYKEALIIKAEETELRPTLLTNNSDEVLIKPAHPSTLDIANAGSLSRANYNRIAAEYSVDVTAPPEELVNSSISFAEAIGSGDGEQAFTYDTLRIDDDYECFHLTGKIDCSFLSTSSEYGFIKCIVAGQNFGTGFGDDKGWTREILLDTPIRDIEGSLPISISTKKTTGFTGSIVAECRLKRSIFEQWQQEVYQQIMGAYNEQMNAYKVAENLAKDEREQKNILKEQAAAEKSKDTVLVTNSKFNAQRVTTELKRLCIEMLTKPFGFEMGRDFYQNGKHDIPEIKLSSDLDRYASHVTFFEQAFDWELMAQKFYPYYWADKADWKTLFQTQDGLDYSYQSFLQSGMGRVVVPVREGFEDAVTYYMETGEVWMGSGIVIDTNDKLYLSIVDETTNIQGVVEGQEWETIVPTTLQVIQGKSVFLDEEGLPCCMEDPLTTLLPDENILNAEPPVVE